MNDLYEILVKMNLGHALLTGQVAIATGAGRGIGQQAARALAHLGARVVIAELNAA